MGSCENRTNYKRMDNLSGENATYSYKIDERGHHDPSKLENSQSKVTTETIYIICIM